MNSLANMNEVINLFIAVWVVFSVGVILWAVYDWDEVEDRSEERQWNRHTNKK